MSTPRRSSPAAARVLAPAVAPVLAPEVTQALHDGRPVVALESTLLAHGLPAPQGRDLADELATIIRAQDAVPAVVAVLDGVVRVGLDPAGLDQVCGGDLVKVSRRDLGAAVALRRDGATTVAATAAVASAAGITMFATGGLGGVHRGASATWDVSADLAALAGTPIVVVCSGVKSILDVAATVEALESLSVPVVGYQTDWFPGFYRRSSGHPVPWRVDEPAQVAAVWAAHRAVGEASALVVGQPVPATAELDAELHERLLADGVADVARRGITGKAITPALLGHIHRASGGASLACNLALVRCNAELAAQIARHIAARPAG